MSSSLLWRRAAAFVAPCTLLLAACGDDAKTATDETVPVKAATVAFVSPSAGANVAGVVPLVLRAEGITIEAAGEVHDGAGHFHVIADAGCLNPGTPVPRDADHVHLGGGQSEGKIYLGPGTHELCLQVGDGAHVALGTTDTVSVQVGVTDRAGWCSVVGQVDELFTATDTGGDAFPVRQVGYENVRRLIAQLSGALDQVDPASRTDVAASLDFGRTVATTFVEAKDAAGAEAALMDLFGVRGVQSDGPGATWILDNCKVDIDG